jgi:hypothetical protein
MSLRSIRLLIASARFAGQEGWGAQRLRLTDHRAGKWRVGIERGIWLTEKSDD